MANALHSNALNFMSFINGGVDPRTGLYTLSISLPALHSDDLAGPAMPLALVFNPLNNQDSGYGHGWNLQLSQFQPASQMLSLSSGESFKVTSRVNGQMLMKEKKLDSFHAAELVNNRYRIAHKSGLVEILQASGSDSPAVPVEIRSADGRVITLRYEYFNGQPLLAEVHDAQHCLLSLVRTGSQVVLTLDPDQLAATFTFILSGHDNRVSRITLPTAEQAAWRLEYRELGGLLHVSEVWTPTGAHKTLRYDDAGHAFPGVSGRPNLRRVTRHLTEPGQGQSPIEVEYKYGTAEVNPLHNFLGYNASGLVWEDNGQDNLYKIIHDYRYGSTETLLEAGRVVRTTERTFNRFHLLTEQRVTQGRKVRRSATVYHIDNRLDFDQQPAYFQLPATVSESWYDLDDPNRVRSETVKSRYDGFGNLLEEVSANGVTETRTWYPAAGEPGQCPPDPEDFVRQMASSTVTPAASEHGETAPVLREHYRYEALPAVGGNGEPWLVVSENRLLQVQGSNETLLQRVESAYINTPSDGFRHGRLLQERLTLNGVTRTTDYAYTKSPDHTVLHTEQTLSSSLDGERKVIELEHSLISGLALLTRDKDTEVATRYRYDALQRVLSETVAPGTEYEATRQYAYGLVGAAGQIAWQEVTDVKSVTRRSVIDGLSRVVEESRQDKDAGNVWRRTYQAWHNARGQLSSETSYDWLGSRNQALPREIGYDDWGQPVSETGADGVVSVSLTEPFGWLDEHGAYMPSLLVWQQTRAAPGERHGLTVSRLNAFGKADSVERFKLDGQSEGKEQHHYDGLGRRVQSFDAQGHATGYRYDVFDRLLCTTLPDGDQVLRQFAAHSSAELPSQVQVLPANGRAATINAGEQGFDSLGRRVWLKTGGRTEHYRYAPGQAQPSERTTAAGACIQYQYAPGLTTEPLSTVTPDEQVTFTYDPQSAQLLSASNRQGSRRYIYASTGHLREATWQTGQDSWTCQYQHSLLGLPLQRDGIDGLSTRHNYDTLGRLRSITQGSLQAHFEYDALGRRNRVVTHTPDACLDTRLLYDEHSREVLRTLYPAGQPPLTLSQTWRADDQLLSRHLEQDGNSLLLETFNCDNRGRLIDYRCSGEQLPADEQGNCIVRQLFRFDALDNLTLSTSKFADGSSDHAKFITAADDPCRLQQVTHSHPSYPASIDFKYDDDGNQLNDQLDRRLRYDSQGRLLEVLSTTGDSLGQYRYDGHDNLLSITRGSEAPRWHFYEDARLSATVQEHTHTHYLAEGDMPLAQHSNDSAAPLLLACNASNSVIAELHDNQYRHARYNAWGERSSAADEPLHSDAGFNGEQRDTLTNCYLLGRGYRAYNPTLMRFHSPDNLSPFGAGGLNPYAYCLGNPVAFQDPSGHSVGQLEYRNFKVNAGGIALNLLMTVAFTALAVGTLGGASPLIVAVSVAGAASGVIGTGYTTAAMLQRDPEKAQRQYEIGVAFQRAEMFLSFGTMAYGMGKSALKRGAKGATKTARKIATPWGMGTFDEGLAMQRNADMFSGRPALDVMALDAYMSGWATKTDVRKTRNPIFVPPRLSSKATQTMPLSASKPTAPIVSPSPAPSPPLPSPPAPPVVPNANTVSKWPATQTGQGLKQPMSHLISGAPTWQQGDIIRVLS